jgi:hypothetical protein
MNTQKIVTRLRLSGWDEDVKERIAGGQTVKAFCEGKGISGCVKRSSQFQGSGI